MSIRFGKSLTHLLLRSLFLFLHLARPILPISF